MSDLRQTKEYARYLESIGWIVEKINSDFIFIRKIPLAPFSVIKFQRPSKINFKKIDRLAKKYHAPTIYLEPQLPTINYQLLTDNSYHPCKSPFLPTKTIQLDLTKSEKQIYSKIKKDARYGIRKAKNECITILRYNEKDASDGVGLTPSGVEEEAMTPPRRGYSDFQIFHRSWKKSVSWQRHVPSLKTLTALKKSFGQKAIFLISTQNVANKVIAGAVILLTGKAAHYYYAFTSKEGRNKSAQYLLVWEAIMLAKKLGCQIFDFEGIYDQRFPIKSWRGFTHFKKSFGGKEVEYPGCFIKYFLGKLIAL